MVGVGSAERQERGYGTHRVLQTGQRVRLRATSWWDCRAASMTSSSSIAWKTRAVWGDVSGGLVDEIERTDQGTQNLVSLRLGHGRWYVVREQRPGATRSTMALLNHAREHLDKEDRWLAGSAERSLCHKFNVQFSWRGTSSFAKFVGILNFCNE